MSELQAINPIVIAGDTLHVRKIGNVCSVYVDANNVAQTIMNFDNPPEADFPVTMAFGEIEAFARAQGKKLRVHEAPKPALKVAADALPPEKMNALIDETLKKKDQKGAVPLLPGETEPTTPATPPTPRVLPTQSHVPSADDAVMQGLNRIGEQFKFLLAKYSVATGKPKSKLKTEIEAVASFLISVDPVFEGLLQHWKSQSEEKRFRL